MSNQQVKRERENELDAAFRAVRFRSLSTVEWLTSEEYRKFIDTWRALREVYIEYDTFTEFNVVVIDIYRRTTALLRGLLQDESLDVSIREVVLDTLAEIEFWMDELIKEAERNLYFIEDMDGEV